MARSLPVSEKKVLNPKSGSRALRSSVRYPSGCVAQWSALTIVIDLIPLARMWLVDSCNLPGFRAPNNITARRETC